MTPDELRALAETLEHECALRLIAGGKNHEEAQACEQAANYLLACADNQPYETERWNVERQSDGSLLVCFNRHEWGEKCEYEHFVPAPAAPQAKKHPDEAAVDRFAAAMKSKLAEKRRQGKSGWDDPRCPTEHLAALLREHVVKGDPLDVGNFAMMLWCRGGSTNETQAEPILRAAAYLRAQADAVPVAWVDPEWFTGTIPTVDAFLHCPVKGWGALYAHPAPPAAQPTDKPQAEPKRPRIEISLAAGHGSTNETQAEPKREPLSEKQIDAIHELWYERAGMSFADVVRAVERAHGITGDSDANR